jgi:hypothetical protein
LDHKITTCHWLYTKRSILFLSFFSRPSPVAMPPMACGPPPRPARQPRLAVQVAPPSSHGRWWAQLPHPLGSRAAARFVPDMRAETKRGSSPARAPPSALAGGQLSFEPCPLPSESHCGRLHTSSATHRGTSELHRQRIPQSFSDRGSTRANPIVGGHMQAPPLENLVVAPP